MNDDPRVSFQTHENTYYGQPMEFSKSMDAVIPKDHMCRQAVGVSGDPYQRWGVNNQHVCSANVTDLFVTVAIMSHRYEGPLQYTVYEWSYIQPNRWFASTTTMSYATLEEMLMGAVGTTMDATDLSAMIHRLTVKLNHQKQLMVDLEQAESWDMLVRDGNETDMIAAFESADVDVPF